MNRTRRNTTKPSTSRRAQTSSTARTRTSSSAAALSTLTAPTRQISTTNANTSRVTTRFTSNKSAVTIKARSTSSVNTTSRRNFSHEGEISEFLGSPAPYTSKLGLAPPNPLIPVYRVTDNEGKIIAPDYKITHTDDELVTMYKTMLHLNNLDKVFYDAQRQGRISFYMTAFGEEATHIGAASAIHKDDTIFAQYREAGVLLWRGFTLEQAAHQCFGTHEDLGKGRQMPVHYGSRELNFQTISSPLATQLPQAVGHAYAMKRDKKPNITVCFFGEGAASEGDFHAALNFAATREAPVLFFCRNNGYAISTPVEDQYRGDGIAGRASGYGMKAIRVDGNDLLAVHEATKHARDYILKNQRPVLLETMSYRAGHHSTSDDSTRYRDSSEIQTWQTKNNPINRFRNLLEARGLWNEQLETETNDLARKEVLAALTSAEVAKKPPVSQLFEDVYDKLPHHLVEQKQQWDEHMRVYGEHYGLDEYIDEASYVNPGKH